MKILYVCSYSGLTGATQVMLSNIDELSSRVNFIVVIPKHGPVEDELKKRKIKYFCISYFNWMVPTELKKEPVQRLKWLVKCFMNMSETLKLVLIMLVHRIDLVQINTIYTSFGYCAAKITNKKVVWYAQEVPEEASKMSFWNNRKAIKSFKNADGLICVSNFVKETILKYGVDKNKIYTVYNSVDLKEKLLMPVFDKRDNIEISVIAGVANEQKNQMQALYAIRILKNNGYKVNLKLIGIDSQSDDSWYIQGLLRYISKNNLKDVVELMGFVRDKETIYRHTDITVSCARGEAFGLTIGESMARGIPVIAANSGAFGEILVGGKNGCLYNPEVVNELVYSIERVIDDQYYREKIISNAREFVQTRLSPKNNAKRIYELYAIICSRNGEFN
ncbi:glycosyltransferase family 4 protein [Lactiplantibacillus daoliensis]|uniref:Glycosyltransferase family 4 protein n=1 Tax=Lactiplantibacillus daoliensis TaxID=2559916 RepID=A0ABW1UEJ3_9LACO|nr:glycosyltransferase family 4 protein [Lactiplantibacillus daoliensis]